ncbi:MAG: hypothetical protein AAF959_00120 [Cyanobacteria bacterium P01_D01_bin.56]
MTSQTPLTGIELISCAKASAASGATVAADNCGYGDNIEQFRTALQTACADVGVDVDGISDLLTEQQQIKQEGGIEIAPDTSTSL